MTNYHNPVKGSLMLPVMWHILRVLRWISIPRATRGLADRVRRFRWRWCQRVAESLVWTEDRTETAPWFVEGYVLVRFIIMAVLLVCQARCWLVAVLSIYCLVDIAIAVMYSVLAEPQERKDKDGKPAVYVKHPSRWIGLSMIQAIEIVVGFALLRVCFPGETVPGPLRVFHDSLCTTLFNPPSATCVHDVTLETVQLLYSLAFFLFVVPVVVNSIRTFIRSTVPQRPSYFIPKSVQRMGGTSMLTPQTKE